jgi:hypothetical protein
MKRFSKLFIPAVLCLSAIICTCTKPTDDLGLNANEDSTVTFTLLNNSSFIFHVDRRASHPDVQSPFEELQEIHYIPVNDSTRYEVAFSANIESVLIMPDSVSGTLVKNTNEIKYYMISVDLFAGGRFMVWISQKKLNAEYTIYGSGVPIIQSERGYLEPSDQ